MKVLLRLPSHCGALWSSLRWLSIGFLCGLYLLNGWSFAVLPGFIFLFFNVEYTKTSHRRFKDCKTAYREDFLAAKEAAAPVKSKWQAARVALYAFDKMDRPSKLGKSRRTEHSHC